MKSSSSADSTSHLSWKNFKYIERVPKVIVHYVLVFSLLAMVAILLKAVWSWFHML